MSILNLLSSPLIWTDDNLYDGNYILTDDSLVFSPTGTDTFYNELTGEVTSYVHRTSDDGSISPPIKITTKKDGTQSVITSDVVSLTPFGYTVSKGPFIVNNTTTKVSGIIGSPLIMSDIFIPALNVGASVLRRPVHGDVCDTSAIRERVTKMFHKKMLDKWLFREENSKFINKYLKVVDGKVKLIDSLKNTDDYINNDQKTVEKKVDFIEDKILSLTDVYTILQQFVKGTNVSWCDLPKQSYFVREAIEKTLENKLMRMIEQK